MYALFFTEVKGSCRLHNPFWKVNPPDSLSLSDTIPRNPNRSGLRETPAAQTSIGCANRSPMQSLTPTSSAIKIMYVRQPISAGRKEWNMLYNCEKLNHEEIKDLMEMEIDYKERRNENVILFIKNLLVTIAAIIGVIWLIGIFAGLIMSVPMTDTAVNGLLLPF